MKLSIIIPCYNESENVTKIYNELLPVIKDMISVDAEDNIYKFNCFEIIFVDDGSYDDTFAKLKQCFKNESTPWLLYKFLKHDVNRGLGAAIRTGFLNCDGDIVVTVDSDGTYRFSDIPALIIYLTPGVDIVTASPYHPKGAVIGVPSYRLFLSKGSSLLYRIFVNWNIHTYTCLFRAYRYEIIQKTNFKSDDFLAGTEILVSAILNGYRVAEFPAILTKRMYGVSKAKILQTILSHLNFQVRLLVSRIPLVIGANQDKQPEDMRLFDIKKILGDHDKQ